jgi:hypothetical protein
VKRIFVVVALLLGVAALVGLAGPSQAASQQQRSTASRLAALERNVRLLQARVAHDEDIVTCTTAVQFDLNDGFLNLFELMAGLPQSSFTPLNDNGACARIGVTRTPPRSLSSARSPFALLRFDLQLMTVRH